MTRLVSTITWWMSRPVRDWDEGAAKDGLGMGAPTAHIMQPSARTSFLRPPAIGVSKKAMMIRKAYLWLRLGMLEVAALYSEGGSLVPLLHCHRVASWSPQYRHKLRPCGHTANHDCRWHSWDRGDVLYEAWIKA